MMMSHLPYYIANCKPPSLDIIFADVPLLAVGVIECAYIEAVNWNGSAEDCLHYLGHSAADYMYITTIYKIIFEWKKSERVSCQNFRKQCFCK